uniref:arylamine N-acetyltransferase n=1 Tax=Sinocyclocheilus grahami TaxID=75366 RepID=A0A672RY17_SINGR
MSSDIGDIAIRSPESLYNSVPFESLTIHIGERNNGLFSWLLSQRGFDVTILSAQARNRFTGAYGPPFDHFIMMVRLEGHRWLCGTDSPQEPRSTELYKFTLEPRERDDFRAMYDDHQSSAGSIFFCKSLCSLLLPTGRFTVRGRRPIITSLSSVDGQQATQTTADLSDEEITELLREKFGIVLHSPLTPKDFFI